MNRKKIVFITGATAGFGKAFAYKFAQHGYDLIIVARNSGALEEVARTLSGRGQGSGRREAEAASPPGGPDKGRATNIRVVTADLSQPRSGQVLVDRLQADNLQVDVLVNNAGFGLQGEFAELPADRQIEMIQLNAVTLTELTRLLLPGMLARRTGGVINVASTAAFQPGPMMSVYYATKAYVLSFTEGIAEEVAGSGVKITCLCPGPTRTGFQERAQMQESRLSQMQEAGLFSTLAVTSAAGVARAGFDGMMAGQAIVVPGVVNRIGVQAIRVTPRAIVRRMIRSINDKR